MKSSCRDDSRRYRIEACSKPGSEVKLAQNLSDTGIDAKSISYLSDW